MKIIVIGVALMLSTQMVLANEARIEELSKEGQQLQIQLQQYTQASEQIKQRLIGIVAIINEYKKPSVVKQLMENTEE